MRSMPEFSIKKPATTIMFLISMVFFGYLGLKKMPVELMPNINRPTIRIRARWDGATPTDMEKMVTKKIEDILPNIEGIVEYTSQTSAESAFIFVKFKYGTDIDTKITLVQNEISQIRRKFPEDMDEPVIRKSSTSDIPVVVFSLAGGDKVETRTYVENVLKSVLERIEGVSEVESFGGQEQEVAVIIDPDKLENYNLGIMDVYNKMASSSINIPGGILREGEKEYLIKVEAEIKTLDEIKNIVLLNRDGHTLRLQDIADIHISPKDRTSVNRKNGKENIVVIVSKTDEGNSVAIVKEVKKAMEEVKGSFPKGVEMTYEFDASTTIINSIKNVEKSGIIGLFLASFILFIFLKSISATLVIATAIPISVIFTFFLLNAQGITLNLMSLMGLSLGIGMLVDNSVVVVDNIFRHMSELGKNRVVAARDGAQEMALPVLASTLTTVSAFMPLVFQQGLAREQFNNLCYAISYSLLASLVISLTFVPMISSKIMNEKKDLNASGKIFKNVQKIYVIMLKWAVRRRGIVVLVVTLLFLGSLFVGSKLGGRFFPTVDEGRFAVIAKLPTGSDVNKGDRIAKILEERVSNFDFIQDFSVSGDGQKAILNINGGLKTTRDKSMNEILQELRKVYRDIPDVEMTIVPGYKFGTRGIYDLEFELYSENIAQLEAIVTGLKERVSKIEGIKDVTTSFEGGKPEGKFYIDREKAQYYNLKISDIARMIQVQILGGVPLKINSDSDEIDVTLKLLQKYRESTEYILDTRITLPNGKNIKISDVAKFKVEEGPSKLEKKDKKKKIVLYANLDKSLDLKTAQEMVAKTLEEMGKPDSVTYGFGGKSSDMAEMSSQLAYTFGIAVFLIYFILVWQFESFIMPFIIILSIPLSTTGAFYALYLARISIDAMVSVGFVMLAGIVVNNAIVLIDFINLRKLAGDNKNKAIITSGKTRLRPILMTTLTTVLGMFPLMFSNGEGSEIYRGMSFVVIFGLSTATLLTLIVIPVFYYLVDDFVGMFKRFRMQKE